MENKTVDWDKLQQDNDDIVKFCDIISDSINVIYSSPDIKYEFDRQVGRLNLLLFEIQRRTSDIEQAVDLHYSTIGQEGVDNDK